MEYVSNSKRAPRNITFGQEIRKFNAGGFTLTETFHPSFFVLPRHDHEVANLNFTIRGSFRETIGRRPQDCQPSSIVVKPAGEMHADKYGAAGAHSLIIEVPNQLLDSHHQISALFAQPCHIQNAFLAGIAMNVYRELQTLDTTSPLLIEGLILELLAYAAKLNLRPSGSSPEWLENARCLLHERFAEPISLSVAADHIGVHPSHLARTFRQRFSCSVGEYINCLRIEYAVCE